MQDQPLATSPLVLAQLVLAQHYDEHEASLGQHYEDGPGGLRRDAADRRPQEPIRRRSVRERARPRDVHEGRSRLCCSRLPRPHGGGLPHGRSRTSWLRAQRTRRSPSHGARRRARPWRGHGRCCVVLALPESSRTRRAGTASRGCTTSPRTGAGASARARFGATPLTSRPLGECSGVTARPSTSGCPLAAPVTNSPLSEACSRWPRPRTTNVTPEHPQMNLDHLHGPLALSETATETDAIAALHELRKAADERDSWKEAAERALSERDQASEKLASLGERQKALAIKQAVHEERIALSEGEDYWTAVTTLGEEWAHRHFNEGRSPSAAASPLPTLTLPSAARRPSRARTTSSNACSRSTFGPARPSARLTTSHPLTPSMRGTPRTPTPNRRPSHGLLR